MFNKIIKEIYEENIVKDIIANMRVKSNDIDDLEQEIYMILLEYNQDRIIEMYEKNQLRYFIVGIISRQYNSKTSPFYKKFKKYYTLVDGNYINNEDVMEDDNNEDYVVGYDC